MAYTVKQLAKLSGTSVRALHFYDEIGLLKPAYCGENGYRYYEEEQVLMLQQILFFKELGFELKDVQKVLNRDSFDKIKTLESHKITLLKNASRMQQLIQTIDKTIARLKGDNAMKDKEIYLGFDLKKQKEYEEYWMKQGECSEALVLESQKRTKNWKKEDYDRVKKETSDLNQEFTKAVSKSMKPTSAEVQALVRRHYKLIEKFYTPTKSVFIGLGHMYINSPEFRKSYDAFHPKLAEFIAEAMKVFAERELA